MAKDINDKKKAIDGILCKINDGTLAVGKPYIYVSYVEEDAAYQAIELLLKNGIPLRINEKIHFQEAQNIVEDKDCLLMVTLISKKYIYSQKGLIDQLFRFNDSVRSLSPDKRQLPCLIIDLEDDRCKYKDDINEKMISSVRIEPMDELECKLIEGLKGLYGISDGNFGKLINREIKTISKDIDSIRRQISFILDYDGHLDNVTNLNDILFYAGNTIKKICRYGIEIDDKLKTESITHFEEWGKTKYCYNRDSIEAEIICSEEDLYIKRGSLIEENPAPDRSACKELKSLYKQLLMDGKIVLSPIPGKLIAIDHIHDIENLENAHIFVTGKKETDCGKYWINQKTGKPYSEENQK